MRLAYTLKNVKYKKSTLQISEDFLRNKVTPLLNDVGARQGSPKEIFVKVNKALRKENEDKIKAITEKSTPSKSVGRRLQPAQQLQGRGQLRRRAHLHLQRQKKSIRPTT